MRLPYSLAFTLALLAGPARAASPESEAMLVEGQRLAHAGDAEGAAKRLERAVELDPAHAAAWAELASLRLAAGQYDRAVAAFERTLLLEPGRDVARYNLALALRKSGRHAEAIAAYRLFLERAPNDADALYGLAESSKARGDLLAAAEAYERYAAAETRPAQARWIEKARSFAAELRRQAAKRSGAAGPSEASTRTASLSESSAAQNKLSTNAAPSNSQPEPSATASNKASVEEGSRSAPAARPPRLEALALLEAGEWARALPQLEAAAAAAPEDPLVLAGLAAAELATGREAAPTYRRALAVAPSAAAPALWLGLGEAHRRGLRPDEARSAYARALELAPKNSPIARAALERLKSGEER